MNQCIEQKLRQYAQKSKIHVSHVSRNIGHISDNLSKVIRTKRDADTFMAELTAIKNSSKK